MFLFQLTWQPKATPVTAPAQVEKNTLPQFVYTDTLANAMTKGAAIQSTYFNLVGVVESSLRVLS